MVSGYCLVEKKHIEVKDPIYDLNKRGIPIVRGTCPSCGRKVQRILKAVEQPADLKAKAEAFKAKHKKGGGRSRSRSKKSRSKSRSRKSSRRSRM